MHFAKCNALLVQLYYSHSACWGRSTGRGRTPRRRPLTICHSQTSFAIVQHFPLSLARARACGNSILEHVSPLSPKYVPTQPDISSRSMRARDANTCPTGPPSPSLTHLLCQRRCPSPSRASGSAWWLPTTTSFACSVSRRGPSPSSGGPPSGRKRPPQPPSLAP